MALENSQGKMVSQINVTPLVDVMLVLLIIFMVTAPMFQQGIDVKLPKASGAALQTSEEPLVVTVVKSGKIFLNSHEYNLARLTETLGAIHERTPDKGVFLKADEQVPYGYVVQTMAAIKKSGVEKIGMVTDVEENGKPGPTAGKP